MNRNQDPELLALIERLVDQILRRGENADAVREAPQSPGVRFQKAPESATPHALYLLVGRIDEELFGVHRDEFVRAMRAEGVPCDPFYPHPLYENPMYGEALAHRAEPCPVAEQVCKDSFWLPLRTLMGSKEDAEDLTQETFLSLHRYGHRFRAEARFSTFVYRVAANAALNRRRSLGRGRARVEKLKHRQAAGDDLPSSPRNPEDSTLGGELSDHVREALEHLTPSLRMPVILYDIEGLAYGEVAKVLGIAEGTVKSRIHRARRALREQLKELLGHTAVDEGF